MTNVSHVSRLTQAGIERMKPPRKGRIQKRDSIVPGLCVRVSETGLKTYSLITRLRGKQVRLPIGKHGVIKLTDARDKAREAMALIDKGIDPRDEKRRHREAPSDAVEDIVEDFMQEAIDQVIKHGTSRHRSKACRVLGDFAVEYGVSLDWLIGGDIEALLKYAAIGFRITMTSAPSKPQQAPENAA